MTTQLAARPFGPKRNHRRSGTRVIAFLGTGPMAANLARAGFEVRVWDRTAPDAAGLVKDGATVAASPAEAVQGAGILITMLADGPATDEVWDGPDGLAAAGPGLIWVQMATVGIGWTQRFANTAGRYGVHFFDAPVSGSAQAGELTILASGPQWMAEDVVPVFAAIGRATAWLGPAGNGTRAKLVLDNWLADLTKTTTEALSFARQLDLDPALILDLLESTPGRRPCP
jgi:3-hydroxyisobutyrate dehydrogenase